MIEQAKLLSMTLVLTLVIWASADSLVNEAVSIRVHFSFEPATNPGMLIGLDPDTGAQWVQLELSGPRRVVEDLRDQEPLELRLPLEDRPTGPSRVPLEHEAVKRALAEQRGDWGKLTVVSLQPSVVQVTIDQMITKELAITMHRLTLAYDEQPEARNLFTTVRMRDSRFRDLPRSELGTQIDISGDVERLLREKPAGQSVTVMVALDSRVYGPGAELDPARIEVTATVRADRVIEEIHTVPIKLVVSFANLAKPYQAVARDGSTLTLVTRTIKVAGPADDVGRLLRGEDRAYGFIQLKESDLEELDVFKAWTPSFQLPSNVELADVVKPIEFKLITPVSAGAGG